MVHIVNELERRIEILEKQLKEKEVELRLADQINFDEIAECRFYNWLLIGLVISMVIFSSTKCYHLVL